jgi:hypothetical protein
MGRAGRELTAQSGAPPHHWALTTAAVPSIVTCAVFIVRLLVSVWFEIKYTERDKLAVDFESLERRGTP